MLHCAVQAALREACRRGRAATPAVRRFSRLGCASAFPPVPASCRDVCAERKCRASFSSTVVVRSDDEVPRCSEPEEAPADVPNTESNITAGVEINGIAHIQLTVLDVRRSKPWWAAVLRYQNMSVLWDMDDAFYAIGGRTGLCISSADSKYKDAGDRFVQRRVGLHHLCFRCKTRDGVDAMASFIACELPDTKIVRAPQFDKFAAGYYSLLVEDPDGIRVEWNHVPGRGHFDSARGRLGHSGRGPFTDASEF